MLSEDAIEKLVKPIIDRQEKINAFVIKAICERIKEISDDYNGFKHEIIQNEDIEDNKVKEDNNAIHNEINDMNNDFNILNDNENEEYMLQKILEMSLKEYSLNV